MRAEDLKGWLAAAKRDGTEREKRIKDGGESEDNMAPTEAEGHWGRVVELTQTAFRGGRSNGGVDLMKAEPPLTQEAWHRLQGWYKATVDRPHHPLELRSGK